MSIKALERLFILLQHLLPKHRLSRLTALFAESRNPILKNLLINVFVRVFGVDLSEARYSRASDYECFNDFFTRPLKDGVREFADSSTYVLSPADGAVSQLGIIEDGLIVQAKGHRYSVDELLGGDPELAEQFRDGSFATIYLSPKDYHRVHMPTRGELLSSQYVPGSLFSVNRATANGVPRLFARNERLVSVFQTPHGKMALVLVGAVIVAGIRTVWGGGPQDGAAPRICFDSDWTLEAGQEMGRFYLGSTAIVLFQKDQVAWNAELTTGSKVRLGEAIAGF